MSQNTDEIKNRRKITDYINRQLVGPSSDDELINDTPHKRYLMGILFPVAAIVDEEDEESPDQINDTISLASEFKPSSMALSFAVSANSQLKIQLSAGSYSQGQAKEWRRTPLDKTTLFNCPTDKNISMKLFDGKGKLTIVKRDWQDGFIVTVALSNNVSSGEILNPQDCLYQTKIQCSSVEGQFQEYPGSDRFKFDEEQQELALLYRNKVNWAVGHGCATLWDQETQQPTWISTSSIPAQEVYGFSTSIDFKQYKNVPEKILSIQHIANASLMDEEELVRGLSLFIDAYQTWINAVENEQLLPKYTDTKRKIVKRLNDAAFRMREGARLISQSPNAMKAFRLANHAMLVQMIHGGSAFGGESRQRNEKPFIKPDYSAKKYEEYTWRPFQLAFQLLVIESLAHDKSGGYSDNRDIVDLLWFPTGGGKTEAYLAVAAWELFYRRFEDGERGAGTAVIKRYTLRLLTSQQFQRAGTLTCALEDIRADYKELGTEPFTLGLWVGQGSTPNNFPQALEKYDNLRQEDEPENPFQLQRCPWCGTNIVPAQTSKDSGDYGIRASETNFSFYCPTESCSFHDKLPIQIVDEALYKTPPGILIGTIDKFARLTWLDKTRSFFGKGVYNPPSLIIQDELHLISGPLGTIAGIYESGIDTLIKHLGEKPKVIAATATIRSAGQQSRRLFGRDVQVFPPSGTDESDSFFSKEDRKSPGRLYIGVMPSGHTAQTALVHTAAAILQSPVETGQDGPELDTWWTLPIYHNSRRELGKTMTLSQDDIPSRIGIISKDSSGHRECNVVEELSANVKGARIPEILDKLEAGVGTGGVVDILPCTNMISVGVDISRLGIMLVNGQPKTTAEYIQASSRVGRDKKRPPAIIITLYSPSKPRDRSHYETFASYHQALYKHVEPTSITPWAKPARERALHAALILLVRLSGYLPANESAGKFDKNNLVFADLLNNFKARIKASSFDLHQSEEDLLLNHIDELVSEWHILAKNNSINRFEANYSGKQFSPLIKAFEQKEKRGVWPTLNSMRNVDTETAILIRGEE